MAKSTSSANIKNRLKELLHDVQYVQYDPSSGKKLTNPEEVDWRNWRELPYDINNVPDANFQGNCIERANYINKHIPDTQTLFYTANLEDDPKLHAYPLVRRGSRIHYVKTSPKDDEWLSKTYTKSIDRLAEKLHALAAPHINNKPTEWYLIDDIPDKKTVGELVDYIKSNPDIATFHKESNLNIKHALVSSLVTIAIHGSY